MKTLRVLSVIHIFLFSTISCLCQIVTGIPNILNFPKDVYNAGTQTWDIAQDKDDIIYFANNEGLLRFDGTFWKLYPLENNLIVRSIAIADNNRIYAGGQNDFGYFAPDKTGRLVFTSLKKLLATSDLSFNYILEIIPFHNQIFFRGRDKIFQYNNKKIQVYNNKNGWMFLGKHQDRLIAQDGESRLLAFTGAEWKPFLNSSSLPANFLVTSIIPLGKDSSLVTTQKGKAYILTDDKVTDFKLKENPFFNNLILSAAPIDDDLVAIGTNLSGCFIVNKKGEVIQNISRKDGLQHNTIISIFRDNRKNLWLGLDNGIDFIATNNAIKHLYPETLNEGVGYSSIIFKNEFYIGTSNGLFKTPLTNKRPFINQPFTFVRNSTGPVWRLAEIEGNLLMAKHEGAFVIKNGTAVPIKTNCGYWNFIPFLKDTSSSIIIAGGYNGIDLLQYKKSSFFNFGKLPDFKVAPRSMAVDNNNSIWVGTSLNGVYRIELNKEFRPIYKRYTEKEGLPSLVKNRIFKIKNQIISATEKGIYQYNPGRDLFELSPYYRNFFKEKDIRLLKEDAQGNLWFVEGKSVGFIDFSNNNQLLYFPELDGKMVSGNNLEFIYPYNRNNIFVGSEKGFYHINLEAYKKSNYVTKVKITGVEATGKKDSLLFDGFDVAVEQVNARAKKGIPEINSTLNSFHFEFSSPSYGYQPSIQYSYLLKGLDKRWSSWTKNAQKDYTNLPPGTYTFIVKAKTNLGEESAVDSYTFTILPPWYRTWWSWTAYGFVLLTLIYLLYKKQKRLLLKQKKKYEEEQKRLQYLHKLELENSEKEIIALKNEKLIAEIEGKNSELASVAMHLVHKGEILSKIKDELVRIKKVSDTEGTSDNLKKLIKALKEEDKMDEDWKQFATHFDNVHSDFIKALKNAYPNLTHSEIKLCTYLQMNLSSKEIAQLLNISVRGVEISRYRLRKKLQIPTETNLNDFFLNFLSSANTKYSNKEEGIQN